MNAAAPDPRRWEELAHVNDTPEQVRAKLLAYYREVNTATRDELFACLVDHGVEPTRAMHAATVAVERAAQQLADQQTPLVLQALAAAATRH